VHVSACVGGAEDDGGAGFISTRMDTKVRELLGIQNRTNGLFGEKDLNCIQVNIATCTSGAKDDGGFFAGGEFVGA